MMIFGDVVLGDCTCNRVVLAYHFKILEGQILVDLWQVLSSSSSSSSAYGQLVICPYVSTQY